MDCLYLDYSKAFGKVYNGLIIAKLLEYGVSGQILEQLQSYLSNRKLRDAVEPFQHLFCLFRGVSGLTNCTSII